MPRGRKLSPLWDLSEEWMARRDLRGQWQVVNADGEQVLRHTDPRVRMPAVQLAAHAPELRAALVAVATRLKNVLLDHGMANARDAALFREALILVGRTRPTMHQWQEVERSAQLELMLDEAQELPGFRAG